MSLEYTCFNISFYPATSLQVHRFMESGMSEVGVASPLYTCLFGRPAAWIEYQTDYRLSWLRDFAVLISYSRRMLAQWAAYVQTSLPPPSKFLRDHHTWSHYHIVWCYRVFHLNLTQTTTQEPLHAQNDEINGNIEFLQPYSVFAVDALLEIGTALISAVLSLDEHLSQTNTSCVPKFCYQ
jgi:hypothetical protein